MAQVDNVITRQLLEVLIRATGYKKVVWVAEAMRMSSFTLYALLSKRREQCVSQPTTILKMILFVRKNRRKFDASFADAFIEAAELALTGDKNKSAKIIKNMHSLLRKEERRLHDLAAGNVQPGMHRDSNRDLPVSSQNVRL